MERTQTTARQMVRRKEIAATEHRKATAERVLKAPLSQGMVAKNSLTQANALANHTLLLAKNGREIEPDLKGRAAGAAEKFSDICVLLTEKSTTMPLRRQAVNSG